MSDTSREAIDGVAVCLRAMGFPSLALRVTDLQAERDALRDILARLEHRSPHDPWAREGALMAGEKQDALDEAIRKDIESMVNRVRQRLLDEIRERRPACRGGAAAADDMHEVKQEVSMAQKKMSGGKTC